MTTSSLTTIINTHTHRQSEGGTPNCTLVAPTTVAEGGCRMKGATPVAHFVLEQMQ